jgi:hypothetical protein
MAKKLPASPKGAPAPEPSAHRPARAAKRRTGGFPGAKLPGKGLSAAPRTDARSLDAFVKSMRMVATSEETLRKKYPDRWVAIHDGKVAAHAQDTNALAAKLAQRHLDCKDLLIRRFDRKRKALAV